MSLELYKIALSQLNGIGPTRANLLLQKLEKVSDIFTLNPRELYLQTGISHAILRELKRNEALKIAEKQLQFNEENKIQSHFISDENYPRRLRQCPDAPIIFFSKGMKTINPQKIVAIVGTRNPTEYGKKLVFELMESLAGLDLVVVSGLAYGVDIKVHEECIEKGIFNIGVLGHSLDRIYPFQHRHIADRMLENGALISEFVQNTKPDRMNFPMRNRIIAGLADAIIVVESKKRGGSLITAELSNDYHRDVFAFPGSIFQEQSEGCNWLIKKQKAHLIQSGRDFLEFMSWGNGTPPKQTSLFPDLDPDELKIYELLKEKLEMHIDAISLKSGFSIAQVNVLLFQLELKNVIHSLSGNCYRIN